MTSLPFAPFKRTRIAPTPSGYLHRGNLFSFLLTHKLAVSCKADLVLRIDDLDMLRVEDDYVKSIFQILHSFSIDWHIGPKNFEETAAQSQKNRIDNYHEVLKSLIDKNLVYACTCSRTDILKRCGDGGYDGHCREKKISLDENAVSWRLKTEASKPVLIADEFGNKSTHNLPKTMFDFVLKRKDGIPAYQVASLADDVFYEIDFIVRGEDLFDSSLAQLYLADTLQMTSFSNIRFLHHPLLLDAAGLKLSKSEGTEALRTKLATGISPAQIKNELLQQLPHKWQHYLSDEL